MNLYNFDFLVLFSSFLKRNFVFQVVYYKSTLKNNTALTASKSLPGIGHHYLAANKWANHAVEVLG